MKWLEELFASLNSEEQLPYVAPQDLEYTPQELDFECIVDDLPWNKKGRKWETRELADILGVCIHHTGGGDNPRATNNYHIGPNHISEDGIPHIAYTWFVNKKGEIFKCNRDIDITWSQGKSDKTHPGDENRHLVSVCFGGNFKSTGSRGDEAPTGLQLKAFDDIWRYLKEQHDLEDNCIFGHYHFGKAACPGEDLQTEVEKIRGRYAGREIKTARKWQKALKLVGAKIKVDGKWGPNSRKALQAYQREQGLRTTAVQDPFTELWLLRQLRKEKKISKL